MKKKIAILGSTGSIGVQALEVIDNFTNLFEVEVLTANKNSDQLICQAKKYLPNAVVISDETQYLKVKEALQNDDIKVYAGPSSLCDIVEMDSIDLVLAAIVGIAGLKPVYRALEYGKPIALANKETLVVAGELMVKKALENKIPIIPVDSEHSAIFQSLAGEHQNEIEKLIITASGGPFRGKLKKDLLNITPQEALKHPNWNMGNKITIDSATLINKGLEVIEAKWLFNTALEKIDIVVHPQSIIHSLVMFTDGSIKAQIGLPDMKLPIQYALTYPYRLKNNFKRFNFMDHAKFTFEEPDLDLFPCLQLALAAAAVGGNMTCVLNAANEVAVNQFLKNEIKFYDISKKIEYALSHFQYSSPKTVDEYLEIDLQCRELVNNIK